MDIQDKVYVAGHGGLVGSAIVRALKKQGHTHLLLKSRAELDLTRQDQVNQFFEYERPDYVFLAAARVGGIHANNTYRGEFIYDNLMIQINVIEAARRFNTKRLLFLGSSCIYPRDCPQPMQENDLLSGPLEKTNEPYAIAKIAGIKLCDAYNAQYGTNFVAVMPTNLYGPYDNFNLETSHVLPAILRKVHEAKCNRQPTVMIWGTGRPKREFLHVDDLAAASLFIMNKPSHLEMVNIGSGEEVSICELSELICEVVGYAGQLVYDHTKPDGAPRKLLDSSKINALGWQPSISLKEGVRSTYEWFLSSSKAVMPA